MIDSILDIESFENPCVIIKGFLQQEWLKQHMFTVGLDQYISNSGLYEHIFLKNLKKLYKYYVKYDYQHQ